MERKKHNSMQGLKNELGHWINDENGVMEIVFNYFRNIYTASKERDNEVIFYKMQPYFWEINEALLKPFTKEEMRCAIKSMDPLKASGLDGFPTRVYQRYWHNLRVKVSSYCLAVL